MKIIEKITLILYSNIILIMSVILCLLVFGWLDANVVANLAKALLIGEKSSGIILGVSVVFILLSIRCIFFDPTSKQEQKDKQGVLLANDNGKLMISKETIENLVEAVTKEYKEAKDVSSRVELDKNNNVNIYVNLVVGSETIIKDLTVDLQNRIKEMLKQHDDVIDDTIIVRFDNITDNGINLLVLSYTNSVSYASFLEEKEKINFKIMQILKEENVELAYDTKTVYVKN